MFITTMHLVVLRQIILWSYSSADIEGVGAEGSDPPPPPPWKILTSQFLSTNSKMGQK